MGLSIAFLGCKKDKTPEDKLTDSKKQIIGTWQVQAETETYYDASGKVVRTKDTDSDTGLTIQFIDGSKLMAFGESNKTYDYTLTNVNNKIMLDFLEQSFEVNFSGNNAMTWTHEETDVQGADYVRSVTVIQLTRK